MVIGASGIASALCYNAISWVVEESGRSILPKIWTIREYDTRKGHDVLTSVFEKMFPPQARMLLLLMGLCLGGIQTFYSTVQEFRHASKKKILERIMKQVKNNPAEVQLTVGIAVINTAHEMGIKPREILSNQASALSSEVKAALENYVKALPPPQGVLKSFGRKLRERLARISKNSRMHPEV